MSIQQECETLQAFLNTTLELIVEIDATASHLPECSTSESPAKLSLLLELCNEGQQNLRKSLQQIELLESMFGVSITSSSEAKSSSEQNKQQPSWFEKALAVTQLAGLVASGGVGITTSPVEAEQQQNRPSYVQEIPPNYDRLPNIAKVQPMSEQLENQVEKLQEENEKKRKEEMEVSILNANQPRVSGSPPKTEE